MTTSTSTIAAIATAHGIGSIAIVRLSGTQALSITTSLIANKQKTITPRYAHLCDMYDSDTLIDKAIVIYFKAPHSFSGEDIVEIQAHGGILIAKLILAAAIKAGAIPAQPGEFSKRAFLNGKIDLSQAESIAQMIVAKDEQMVKQLARNLKGEIKQFVDQTREELIALLAYSEVSIDYAQEGLPTNLITQMQGRLQQIKDHLYHIKTYSQRRINAFDGVKVVFVGKPNVGKSSLLNVLMGYDRAIVSEMAGTTRDSLQEQILINGHLVTLIDTAGIREANNSIEQMGIERTIAHLQQADIVVALFDSSHLLDKEDQTIIKHLQALDKHKLIIALSKSDLPQQLVTAKIPLKTHHSVHIHCQTKYSDITPLVKALEALIVKDDNYEGVVLTSQRQITILDEVYNHIDESVDHLHHDALELFSYHINGAIEVLSTITEPFAYNELLDNIFGNFCLGK